MIVAAAVAAVDLTALTGPHARCILQRVRNAAKTVRSPSNQQKEGLSIAGTALASRDGTGTETPVRSFHNIYKQEK